MKKKTNGQLKKILWKLVSEYVRRKGADPEGYDSCYTCGARHHWKELQAGHYVRKSAGLSVYFEPRNLRKQCFACNIWRDGNTDEYALRLQKELGKGILEELNQLKHQSIKIHDHEYLAMIEEYKENISKL